MHGQENNVLGCRHTVVGGSGYLREAILEIFERPGIWIAHSYLSGGGSRSRPSFQESPSNAPTADESDSLVDHNGNGVLVLNYKVFLHDDFRLH